MIYGKTMHLHRDEVSLSIISSDRKQKPRKHQQHKLPYYALVKQSASKGIQNKNIIAVELEHNHTNIKNIV